MTINVKFVPLFVFQYELQRIDFDEAISTIQGSKDIPAASAVRVLLRKLLFFHSDSKDTQRLVRVQTQHFIKPRYHIYSIECWASNKSRVSKVES